MVERTIGLLKGRWRCLDATGGKLSYKPDKVCQIVRVCAVLVLNARAAVETPGLDTGSSVDGSPVHCSPTPLEQAASK